MSVSSAQFFPVKTLPVLDKTACFLVRFWVSAKLFLVTVFLHLNLIVIKTGSVLVIHTLPL